MNKKMNRMRDLKGNERIEDAIFEKKKPHRRAGLYV